MKGWGERPSWGQQVVNALPVASMHRSEGGGFVAWAAPSWLSEPEVSERARCWNPLAQWALAGFQGRAWVQPADQRGRRSRRACSSPKPLWRGLPETTDRLLRSLQRARRHRLNLLPMGLEFKLTLLPQPKLCSKSFLELLILYIPQENSDLEQSPEN